MKYRIENGEVNMPVSELNRLNDEAEALKKREDRVNEIERRLSSNSVPTAVEMDTYTEFSPYGPNIVHTRIKSNNFFSDIDGVLKKAVDAETKRMQFYVDEKAKRIKELENTIETIKSLSVRDFKRRYK